MAIDTETMQLIERVVARAVSNATSLKGASDEIAKGVTQYVGARYVPLFAEPLEWDKTKAYEPLTIVLYQGNSFTSRQYVPTGVEIDNESFWANTGNYNAQVEQYRQEVKTYVGRITANADAIAKETEDRTAAVDAEKTRATAAEQTLQGNIDAEKTRATTAEQTLQGNIDAEKTRATAAETKLTQTKRNKRVCICIGNSFTIGYYTHNYGIGDYVADSHYFDETYVYGKDSSSFDNYTLNNVTINNSNNFNSMVNEAATDSKFVNDSVTDVIFISAMGDTRALAYKQNNNTELKFSNFTATIDNAKSKFKNAKIFVAFAEWCKTRGTCKQYSPNIPYMQIRAHWLFSHQSDAIYLGWISAFGNMCRSYKDYFMPDGYHPTKDGSILLGNMLLRSLTGDSSVIPAFNYFAVGKEGIYSLDSYSRDANKFPSTTVDTIFSTCVYIPYNEDVTYNVMKRHEEFCLFDGTSDYDIPYVSVKPGANYYLFYRESGQYKYMPVIVNMNKYDKQTGKMYLSFTPNAAFTQDANTGLVITAPYTSDFELFEVLDA